MLEFGRFSLTAIATTVGAKTEPGVGATKRSSAARPDLLSIRTPSNDTFCLSSPLVFSNPHLSRAVCCSGGVSFSCGNLLWPNEYKYLQISEVVS